VNNNWSESECRALVRDYLDMWSLEQSGKEFSKADHWRNLLPHLNNRTKAAIERKYQNVSAILQELEMKFVEGYKPLSNYQLLLKQVVYEVLREKTDLAHFVPKVG
jgi:hypothetical protein